MSPIGTMAEIQQLLAGAIPSRPPHGFAYLATVDAAGAGRVRTMTLRGFDAAAGTVWTSCHSASQKTAHLRRQPQAEVCLWLGETGVQLRLECTWRIVDARAADPALQALRLTTWEGQPPAAKALYDTPAPGTVPEPFCVLRGTFQIIDALLIRPTAYAHFRHVRTGSGWYSEKLAR